MLSKDVEHRLQRLSCVDPMALIHSIQNQHQKDAMDESEPVCF